MGCFNIWLTGLSGAGKTTIANQLSNYLTSLSLNNEVLDGDIYRDVLSANAGYSEKERNAFRKKIIFFGKGFKQTWHIMHNRATFIKQINKG